jgi:glyoxylase-like metal-dependent hydrolase (beta-lactamase superfamily II)
MILETLFVGSLEVNCYILAEGKDSSCIIIDPGYEEEKIKKVLVRHRLKPAFIINTHGHIDHIGCDDKFNVPVYIHRKDAPLLKDADLNLSNLLMSPFTVNSEIRQVEDQDNIELGQIRLKVIHVPGHTPGGICLSQESPKENILFTGDSLFCGGIGRTDFLGADEKMLIKNIKDKLLVFPDDTVIYPGHGPSSTIGREKTSNPFLS